MTVLFKKAVNDLKHRAPLYMFDTVLNTPFYKGIVINNCCR